MFVLQWRKETRVCIDAELQQSRSACLYFPFDFDLLSKESQGHFKPLPHESQMASYSLYMLTTYGVAITLYSALEKKSR